MHQPVLYKEIIHAMQPARGGKYVDGTLGAGGHAVGILEASAPDGLLLGIDLDPVALALAGDALAPFGDRATLVKGSYTDLRSHLIQMGWASVQGIILDLGVSSMQLDAPERGFSFMRDAPLDMRFSPDQPTTAADLVNSLPEADLANLIFEFGEDRHSRRIARAIVNARPIQTTGALARVIASATTGGNLHPATRTFQALRIATNGELDAVRAVLPQAVEALAPGGRLAVIAFHSLEDRIVKQYFRRESKDCICPPEQPVCTCNHQAVIRELKRKPTVPLVEEAQMNPRARSARLRVVEKL